MKIAQSNVNLVSSHQYYEENTVTIQSGVVDRGSFLENLNKQEKSVGKEPEQEDIILKSDNYNDLRPMKTSGYENTYDSLVQQISQIRARLLETIMSFLQILGENTANASYKNMLQETSGMISDMSFVKVTTIQMSHVEEEATTFSGKGVALTEDGREIDFNVDFSLSRRLMQSAGLSIAGAVSMIDPLVINVGSDVTSISDQSFFFDLDCDGQEEKIAGLGAGSGFLAYDKNGDGMINDGSELFGTKSGNGFKDLSEYDSDGNGWIDENDEIYGKLQVWIRGEDGVDKLLSLQEADVGAIYLGNVETQHSMYTDVEKPDDTLLSATAAFGIAGMMRASGLFLRESGGAGTVHQIDLARM